MPKLVRCFSSLLMDLVFEEKKRNLLRALIFDDYIHINTRAGLLDEELSLNLLWLIVRVLA